MLCFPLEYKSTRWQHFSLTFQGRVDFIAEEAVPFLSYVSQSAALRYSTAPVPTAQRTQWEILLSLLFVFPRALLQLLTWCPFWLPQLGHIQWCPHNLCSGTACCPETIRSQPALAPESSCAPDSSGAQPHGPHSAEHLYLQHWWNTHTVTV